MPPKPDTPSLLHWRAIREGIVLAEDDESAALGIVRLTKALTDAPRLELLEAWKKLRQHLKGRAPGQRMRNAARKYRLDRSKLPAAPMERELGLDALLGHLDAAIGHDLPELAQRAASLAVSMLDELIELHEKFILAPGRGRNGDPQRQVRKVAIQVLAARGMDLDEAIWRLYPFTAEIPEVARKKYAVAASRRGELVPALRYMLAEVTATKGPIRAAWGPIARPGALKRLREALRRCETRKTRG